MGEYEAEVKARWGDTIAYKQSSERTSKYSAEDFAKAKADQEAVTEALLACFTEGKKIDSEGAQKAVLMHREAISKWFYDCSPEMQKNLALMYISDERFKKYYDDRSKGLAQYVHDNNSKV
jgi:hypothetical protein